MYKKKYKKNTKNQKQKTILARIFAFDTFFERISLFWEKNFIFTGVLFFLILFLFNEKNKVLTFVNYIWISI